ncbi:MAG: hypothetical protein DMF64_17905 [Acidobacteria bacterium]|nr:MAG: hypothetical protein DMF64_17905 [Acidobacteriota bacterium]
MKAKMQTCNLVLRRLTTDDGIVETNLPIKTLEELYNYCVTKTEPHLIERILLTGQDAGGRARLLTFVFQSVADHER